MIGDSVTRVGATTGRQSGHVILTGVIVPVLKSFPFKGRILLLDQAVATYFTDEGDSGGPVFHIGDATDVALLEGVHWGFVPVAALSFFSPISNVQKEIGPLTFAATSQPDLVAVSPPSTFCTEVGGKREVAIRVANVGGAFAGPSTTKVDFPPFGSISLPTPSILRSAFFDLPLIDPTSLGACTSGSGDCSFAITVDANNDVVEGPAGEANNTTVVNCPG